jgi:phenylacetic acid degradation operon negative regulatory protein
LHLYDLVCNVRLVRRPTAKSLTLDLLSSLRGGAMPVAALVAAARLFGIDENALRVAIARLLAAGQIARDERGQYSLGAAAHAIDRRVLGWRAAESRVARWDGGWWLVRAGALPPARSRERRGRERALALLGFAEISPGLALRPDNLRAALSALRSELLELGLEGDALIARVRELDADSDARARALWRREKLAAAYRRSLAELAASEARLAALPEERAMVESFLLGGRVIRELVLDPLLPEPLAPEAERRALAAAMRRYDRAGRRAWASFMARHGAPHAATPANGERTLSLAIA